MCHGKTWGQRNVRARFLRWIRPFNYPCSRLRYPHSDNSAIVEEWKTNFMSLAILFHSVCPQHVSDINMSIIRSLRLCCWITTSVGLVLSSLCVGALVCLVLGDVRFAGWSLSLQNEHHLKPATPKLLQNLMFVGPCIIVIVEEWKTILMSLAILFNSFMFRTLIYPSSRTCDCVDELPHRSSCSQFVVCWSFGAAGFEWCSFCRL